MRFFLIITVLLAVSLTIQANNLRGIVKAQNGQEQEPVEFANVALFSLSDSALITGTVTNENGEFSLSVNGNADNLFLQISFFGYETQTVPALQNQTIVLIPTLNELGEVVVSANYRIFRVERGDIVVSVRNTVLETLTTASEVMTQLPFLSKTDDNFTVFGRGIPTIYINNRLVRDNQELEQLSPADIRSIRVITSPGAAYDATVRAVVKITTERPVGEGLSGLLSVHGAQGRRFSGSEQVELNYRTGAWDIFASTFYNHHRNSTFFDTDQQMFLSDAVHRQIYGTNINGGSNRLTSTVGINFTPNSNHAAGIRYLNNFGRFFGSGPQDIVYFVNDISENIQLFGRVQEPIQRHCINAYYDGQLTDNLSFNINSDILIGDNKENQNIYFLNAPEEPILTNSTQQYTLYGARGILLRSLQQGSLSVGAEFVHTNVVQTYSTQNPGLGLANTNNEAVQNRTALFTSYQMQFGHFGLTAGVRYENIVMDYFDDGTKSEEQSKIYNRFFPNISLSYTNNAIQSTLGFVRHIRYPTYSQLRSNVQYVSPFMYESGNPLLLPAIENSFSAMFAWQSFQAMIGHSVYENTVAMLPLQFEDKPVIMLRPENLRRMQTTNIGITYVPVFGIWRPRFEAGAMFQWLNIDEIETSYNKPTFNGRWLNTFSFPQNYTLRVDISARTGGHSDVTYMYSSWGVDVRLLRTFLSNRLTVQLAAIDIFATNTNHWRTDYKIVDMMYNRNPDSRQVSLTAVYRFNATQNRFRGQQSTDEINRL
jgi:hypothetical protein